MPRKTKEKPDKKNLIQRGEIWYVKRMVQGEVIYQSTHETDVKKAIEFRDRTLYSTYLHDERERTAAVLAKVATVEHRLAEIERAKPALFITDTWAAYVNAPNRPDSGERTLQGYESQFARFVKWMQEHHKDVVELRAVTEEIAFAFATKLNRENTPNTYNKYLVLYRRIWKTLWKVARLTVNPWESLENKLLNTHSRRELSVSELTEIMRKVDGEMRILFSLGLYCGLRLGDATLLKWSNVNLDKREIIVTPTKTARRSNGKVLKLPLHDTLHAVLSETPIKKRQGYIMPGLVNQYLYKNTRGTLLVKQINEVFEACGIQTQCAVAGSKRKGVDVGFHSLRHSFVSLSANAGVALAAVQAVVGHSNPAMTRHYLHADPVVVKKAVSALPDVTGKERIPTAEEKADERRKALKDALQRMTAETWEAERDALLKSLTDEENETE